jgi:hypothetical protein
MASSSTPEPPATAPAHDPVAQALALLQPWIDYVPQQQRRLGIFICIALLVHLIAFFFIRIDSSRGEMRHSPRTHVTVAMPHASVATAGAPSDDFSDRLFDPRLFLLPLNPPPDLTSGPLSLDLNTQLGSGQMPDAMPPAEYQASQPIATTLDQRASVALTPPRQPFSYDEKPPISAAKTTWQWDDALAQRQPTTLPDLPSPISDTDLSPTKLRVAVGTDGEVEHVLIEQSSGDFGAPTAKDLDQQAISAAEKIRFKTTDQPGLVWGDLTIFWRYSAKPREEVVPTPPTIGQ